MNRKQHLMIRAMEECAEVAQRISKALIFGLEEKQTGQPLTNSERILKEYTDLIAVMDMAGFPLSGIDQYAMNRKYDRVEAYLEHSRACGTLDGEPVRLRCSRCGKSVSSGLVPVPTDTPDRGLIVRAFIECPECCAK